MLWYGKSQKLSYLTLLKRASYRNKKLSNRNLLFQKTPFSNKRRSFYFYIPADWKLCYLTPSDTAKAYRLCYIYSQTYFFKLLLNSWGQSLSFSLISNILVVNSLIQTPLFSLYFQTITDLFLMFTKAWFRKLKIKGKGYYIYKNFRNTVTHQFGHSHRVYIYTNCLNIKFLSKTSILVLGLSKLDVLKSSLEIRSSKPLNIFTGRGVRFSKQIIYKKTGKVSSYR